MTDTQITAPLALVQADLRQLDATMSALRQAERDVAALVASLAEARDALAAAPRDPEAARRVAMTLLRMRADAFALTQNFAALAQRDDGP